MDNQSLSDTERAAVLLGLVAGMLMRLPAGAPPAATDHSVTDQAPRLRTREQSIIALVGNGCSNKEIGRELGITPETVKFHLKRIFRKLEVRRRAEAVVQAHSRGLLTARLDARLPRRASDSSAL